MMVTSSTTLFITARTFLGSTVFSQSLASTDFLSMSDTSAACSMT